MICYKFSVPSDCTNSQAVLHFQKNRGIIDNGKRICKNSFSIKLKTYSKANKRNAHEREHT